MLNEEDKATVKYLRNSPKDALKKEAADLIERLDYAAAKKRIEDRKASK